MKITSRSLERRAGLIDNLISRHKDNLAVRHALAHARFTLRVAARSTTPATKLRIEASAAEKTSKRPDLRHGEPEQYERAKRYLQTLADLCSTHKHKE